MRAPLSTGAQKLGQPVLESNLVLDENSKAPQANAFEEARTLLAVEWA